MEAVLILHGDKIIAKCVLMACGGKKKRAVRGPCRLMVNFKL